VSGRGERFIDIGRETDIRKRTIPPQHLRKTFAEEAYVGQDQYVARRLLALDASRSARIIAAP
jgi:hypothetical protein